MTPTMKAAQVHEILGRHMLVDGYDLVLDLDRSTPTRLVDAVSGKSYIDMFSHFASAPLGTNHPGILTEESKARLLRAAINKPANSDIYTDSMAGFVDAFSRVGIPDELPHAFFVSGGALAVENALKAAFDWKVRKNLAAGRGELGTKVLHFKQAFHGRTGYTLSLTNTSDPRKTMYFPKFDWPRVSNPFIRFPLAADLDRVMTAETATLKEIADAFDRHPHDIASIVIEPIQAEGGDNHFRPEFLAALRRVADEREALLIFDEVQTGVGLTGKFWAYQHYNVVPDILCFGKKMQVCGILAGQRIDEVEGNVFQESSRINSTWGGNLVDMVRAGIYLEIIERDGLIDNAAKVGTFLLDQLQQLQAKRPDLVSNARGLGLMSAISLPTGALRNQLISALSERGVLMLPCGDVSVRFRPALCVAESDIAEALEKLDDALRSLTR